MHERMEFLQNNENTAGILLDMLDADDHAFVLVGKNGNIITQTQGACRLLQQPPLRPIGEVLSEQGAAAVKQVLKNGGTFALDEEVDGQPYHLEIRAAPAGAVVHLRPCSDIPALPRGLSEQISSALSHILAVLHLMPASTQARQDSLLDELRRSSLRIYRGISHLQLVTYRDDPERILAMREGNLARLCARLVQACSEQITSVEIEADLPDICTAVYDEGLMTQAILNLLVNALRAQDVTHVHLTLTRHEDDRIVLTVEDNGRGLSAPEVAGLYKGWQRVLNPDLIRSTAAVSGLGLPLVRRIIGWHRGTLLLDQTDDSGTIFRLTFPGDINPEDYQLAQSSGTYTLDAIEVELSAL